MDLELLENLQEKNPKIIAEYFFENYEFHEINKLVKQIQKKIMEKNNSLKLMLSHRYVDLLDCSELIENLKHYSNRMSGIAERNAENIKNSLKFISEKKSVPHKVVEPKKISSIDRSILLQRKALEIGNRDIQLTSISEKIYFLILFLINSPLPGDILGNDSQDKDKKLEYIHNISQLKDLLTELLARLMSSLGQLIASNYTIDRKEILIFILGIIRGVQYFTSDSQTRVLLEEIVEDTLPQAAEGLENIPQGQDVKGILEFSFKLIKKVVQTRLESSREAPAKTLKYFLRIVRDFFWMLSEESDGYVIKKVDESVQTSILNSQVFRAWNGEEEYKFERMLDIFGEESESVIQSNFESMKEFVKGITPHIETLIRDNSKINSKFNAEFLSEVLWENDQKDLLQTLKTRYELDLPQTIEEVFRNEWKSYSEYYIKKIIEDFTIEESFTHILKSVSPYLFKQENASYPKAMNVEKINKRLHEAADIADRRWKKSVAEYDEFWGTFDKNMFQSLAELEHLEEIIAESLLKKVVAVDNDFNKIFFANKDIEPRKHYALIVILVNYLELTYQKLSEIVKDLKKKGLFEKLLKSLCDRIYETIQNDTTKQISDFASVNPLQGTENGINAVTSEKSFKILAKINKKLLQFQLEHIENPKYPIRFKEYIKQESLKLVSPDQQSDEGHHSLVKHLKSTANPSTHPLDFFYFMEGPELEKTVKANAEKVTHKSVKKEKALNIRDTLFLEKLSVDQNEFLNDYTVIPVQKFTLKKKVESVVAKKEKKPEVSTTAAAKPEESGSQSQFGINDRITEKAKNLMGGVFNKLLTKK